MSNETPKPEQKNDAQVNKEVDTDADEAIDEGDYIAFPESLDKESIRRDARRKIEIYWEKKRLREQFEDFDESEFGF
jgi:hypothetical protein